VSCELTDIGDFLVPLQGLNYSRHRLTKAELLNPAGKNPTFKTIQNSRRLLVILKEIVKAIEKFSKKYEILSEHRQERYVNRSRVNC
jgi:hypothetical protein